METICLMRDICRAIETFEADFVKVHHMSLNEGMLLCSLSEGQLSAACLAEVNVMSPSHTSKVIRSLEEKGLIRRIRFLSHAAAICLHMVQTAGRCISS